jgi:hypothetical protein
VAGFSRYEDIVAWQLADELKREVFALTATGQAARDFKFRPAEFARFLEFARGSLTETHNSLRDGRDRGYFSAADCDRLSLVAGRAAKATTRLTRYLRSCRAEP